MSPSSMNSSAILKETSRGVNCGLEAITTTTISKDEPAEMKNLRMSFSHTFILKKNAKEKQLKTATQTSDGHLAARQIDDRFKNRLLENGTGNNVALGTLGKVMTVYEEAILAGAQPELRNALTDVIKDIKSLSRSSGEFCKEDICTEEANLDEKVEVQQNSEVKPNNEETSPKAEACLKPKEESFLGDEEPKIIKSSQMPKEYKKEQNVSETPKNIIFKTPENDEGSYSIKYNVSTTPSLNSVTEKLRSENSKTAVKDLKVLTPVRRSRRLHEKVYKLPDMLKDHNPCISSLEQLGKLGGEATAFVYRPNSALHKVLEGEENLTLQN
uniref:Uncharacterized protein n=1 Tax=Sphaerodactylus townsendi TaxID=933632 RepID=A0ACB8EEX8_9SAUR